MWVFIYLLQYNFKAHISYYTKNLAENSLSSAETVKAN